MPSKPRSLTDMIGDIAFRKQRAGRARYGRASAGHEAPKDVFLRACAAIGEAFVTDGFRFAASGPHLTRRCGDFVFRVAFQSSTYNVAGDYVAIWIHASVCSPVLKKWRITNRSVRGPYDCVAGDQIGNLAEHPSWLEWNVAERASAEAEVRNAISTIRELAMPYFAEFTDPGHICRKLLRGQLAGMDLMESFDFVACFSSIQAARQVAVRWLFDCPELVDEYHETLQQYQQTGVPDRVPSGWVEVLAALSVRFALGDLTDSATDRP